MNYKVIDVRGITGNFFPGILKQAQSLSFHEGIEVIQSFDPLPLYEVMESLGYSYKKEIIDNDYHIYFIREEIKEEKDILMRPVVLTNMPMIDKELGDISVHMWDLTWNDEKRYLSYNMRLLLSLMNAVGAGRMRQASRELLKAYQNGLDSQALDDVFELLIWNQGIGYFSSEIAHSSLFKAYRMIKRLESKNTDRVDICKKLKETFVHE